MPGEEAIKDRVLTVMVPSQDSATSLSLPTQECAQTHMHIHKHTHIYMHTHICAYMCTNTRTCIYMEEVSGVSVSISMQWLQIIPSEFACGHS